jgi:hypothetical protein
MISGLSNRKKHNDENRFASVRKQKTAFADLRIGEAQHEGAKPYHPTIIGAANVVTSGARGHARIMLPSLAEQAQDSGAMAIGV